MCTEVYFPRDRACVGIVADLADRLDVRVIPMDRGGFVSAKARHCLCGVNFDALARARGWALDWDSDPPYLVIHEPPPPP